MNTRTGSRVVTTIAAALGLAACGGGSGSSSAPSSGNTNPGTTSTAGLWKGGFTSTTTGQSSVLVVMTDGGGHSTWMTTDGRIYDGTMPMDGSRFESHLAGYMDPTGHFPDGTNMGPGTMTIESHSTSMMDGHYTGSGDHGTFDMRLSSMWMRGAGLDTVAGTYMRTTSTGYAMTMTLGANGQVTGSDTAGCMFNGTVTAPDPSHNLYHMDVSVTSCGVFDGTYQGMGTLVDADAMQDWMSRMPGYQHGGMMGGSGMMGRNAMPNGRQNLFMFSIVNDRHAMMDALAR
jgi:hypothetical protein